MVPAKVDEMPAINECKVDEKPVVISKVDEKPVLPEVYIESAGNMASHNEDLDGCAVSIEISNSSVELKGIERDSSAKTNVVEIESSSEKTGLIAIENSIEKTGLIVIESSSEEIVQTDYDLKDINKEEENTSKRICINENISDSNTPTVKLDTHSFINSLNPAIISQYSADCQEAITESKMDLYSMKRRNISRIKINLNKTNESRPDEKTPDEIKKINEKMPDENILDEKMPDENISDVKMPDENENNTTKFSISYYLSKSRF